MIAKQTAFFTGDRKRIVAESDPEAKFLFVREGCEVSDSEVTKYPGAAELISTEAKTEKPSKKSDDSDHAPKGKGK